MSLDLTSASLEVQYMHMYVKCRSMTNFLSLLQGEHTGERWDGSGTVLPHASMTYLHMCGCKLLYHATTSRIYSYTAMFDINHDIFFCCHSAGLYVVMTTLALRARAVIGLCPNL